MKNNAYAHISSKVLYQYSVFSGVFILDSIIACHNFEQ